MRKTWVLLAMAIVLVAIAMPLLFGQQQGGRGAAQAPPAPQPGPAPGIPLQISGLRANEGVSNNISSVYNDLVYRQGYDPVFNRVNLNGWHTSPTNFHGVTPNFFVSNSVLIGTQNPHGFGGILLSDRKFKNADIYMEVKPDWGCDSGLFLRTAEDGSGYQVMFDYLPGGNMGGVIGERLEGMGNRPDPNMTAEQRQKMMEEMRARNSAWTKVWKREDWNSIKVHMEGTIPHIQVWINDTQVTDFKDTANHAKGGIERGPIGIQVHWGDRWLDGHFWRWRGIAVRELPD